MSISINSEDCVYTSCYCEENVWHVCKYVKENHPGLLDKCVAVFISNEKQTIPLWSQKQSTDEKGLVIWDYHVIFIYHAKENYFDVYDLDTTLPFPCSFEEYKTKALGLDHDLQTQFQRYFRVIPAEQYLTRFASDRSHMIKDAKWLKPPPNYPPIFTATSANNLNDFISMSSREVPGQIFNYRDFVSKFS
ncbi:protein N-terminal glutamine amidohydrolase-like [Daphnia pulex]|uniref:protein N-terminal glutamine amidohydrolase-like n=1 Tax=Daphnia pulex TaxID=6669 RepID=UPI001EDE8673|nr:protein N-terminal glutamine amidohydrolase-like [Daphnia pulex]